MRQSSPWLLALLLAACALPALADQLLKVGSKRFTESYILAHVLAQTAARATGSQPQVREGLANTPTLYEALRSAILDRHPEYAGTHGPEHPTNPGPKSPPHDNHAPPPPRRPANHGPDKPRRGECNNRPAWAPGKP